VIFRRKRRDEAESRAHARDFAGALILASLALPGALPGSRGAPDPIAFFTWIAFTAAAIGALAGGRRLPLWPHAAAIPSVWMFVVVSVDALGPRDLPTPLWASIAASGLFAFGYAVGRITRFEQRFAVAGWMLALAVVLVLMPVSGGILRAAWPGTATEVLLDASPATLLAECAGIDWLRHPAVYDAAGTADLDPSSRSPYSPALAASLVAVLGSLAALLAVRLARRHVTNPT